MNIKYEHNQNIMETITEANIIKYIELTKKERIIEDVKKLISLHPNMLLTDFLNQFIKDFFDKVGIKIKIKNCYFKPFPLGTKYFELFYEDLFDGLGLTPFFINNHLFYLYNNILSHTIFKCHKHC